MGQIGFTGTGDAEEEETLFPPAAKTENGKKY